MDHAVIEQRIVDFVASYPAGARTETVWREPIVGIASAEDPLFDQLKQIIRPTHATPREVLPGAKSVVAYFIPFSERLHRENFEAEHYASRSWAVAYLETNRLISDVNEHLRIDLESRGHRVAVIPPTHNFDQKSLLSDWSHRHVAYAAGIGRFGVHHLMITEKGCTGRVGTFVTDLALEPSRPLDQEFCLHKAGIDCLQCVQRCRYAALSADGFDRHACYRQCLANDRYHEGLDLVEVCGKCSAMVPCSVTNPVREAKKG
jgi:epoxyqueuosine reductase QueG